ncbi:hypothetical protein IU412_18765 [Nocardia cyriacigeorgica]|jgi:hypothetical protein|nr:hypothetical protein [Nocardia cyriacigeorgica]MBF6201236.1 hypothetical protein [Nocardia cyriacigeorgica]MBF6319677.1 hypothetical protein [Nocardia cyriacigeorgica]MBF6326254.1 hypothetical protein [Nocardia cyriacigeorgica]MBF6498285.1 hypothetical protein [Nocardia cyriacigeorgica]
MALMQVEPQSCRELVAAMLSAEFVDGGVDPAALRRVHAGEHAEWALALDRSGMFGTDTVAAVTARWREDPRVLLDALLTEADDVTRRRCLTAWAALDDGGAGTRARMA